MFIKPLYSAAAFHNCAWSLVTWVLLWCPLGGPLCWWPCYLRWMAGGMCQKALDLTRSNGRERTESKMQERHDLDLWYGPGPPACAVCRTGEGSNRIISNSYKHWVHKKCSWLKGLTEAPDCRCTRCQGTACPLNGRPQREVEVGPDKLEVGPSFCYLGDMLSAAVGCALRPQHA